MHLLERTLRRLIEEQLRQRPREIEPNPPSVLERMAEILAVLRDAWSLLFSAVVGQDRRRSEIVVSLLAVLELMRLGRVRAQQTELFGEIVIERPRPDRPPSPGRGGGGVVPASARRRSTAARPGGGAGRRTQSTCQNPSTSWRGCCSRPTLRWRPSAFARSSISRAWTRPGPWSPRCASATTGEARALQIAEVAGGYRMVTRPELAPWLVRLARTRTRVRLSRAALEALAIVAYKQPVSRPEIDAVRGVNSEGVLDNLLERRLVRIGGRKEAPGRPFLFETTREFLVAFGLRDLGDLPTVEANSCCLTWPRAGRVPGPRSPRWPSSD